MPNQLTKMARDILAIESDLPFRLHYETKPYPDIDDFELYTFMQAWGSTALGFPGVGGQAITHARTYVLVPVSCNQKCFVYFAGRFAYQAEYNETFREDLRRGEMASVAHSHKYHTKDQNNT